MISSKSSKDTFYTSNMIVKTHTFVSVPPPKKKKKQYCWHRETVYVLACISIIYNKFPHNHLYATLSPVFTSVNNKFPSGKKRAGSAENYKWQESMKSKKLELKQCPMVININSNKDRKTSILSSVGTFERGWLFFIFINSKVA